MSETRIIPKQAQPIPEASLTHRDTTGHSRKQAGVPSAGPDSFVMTDRMVQAINRFLGEPRTCSLRTYNLSRSCHISPSIFLDLEVGQIRALRGHQGDGLINFLFERFEQTDFASLHNSALVFYSSGLFVGSRPNGPMGRRPLTTVLEINNQREGASGTVHHGDIVIAALFGEAELSSESSLSAQERRQAEELRVSMGLPRRLP